MEKECELENALNKLIKVEEKNIIDNINEYLPIRDLLVHVILPLLDSNIKQEWMIEKTFQDKRTPVIINNIDYDCTETKDIYNLVTFYIYDQAFSSEFVLNFYAIGTDNNNSDQVVYRIYYRYYIGSNKSEFIYIGKIDFPIECIEWGGELDINPRIWLDWNNESWISWKKNYHKYMKGKTVFGISEVNEDIRVVHTVENYIMTLCIRLRTPICFKS